MAIALSLTSTFNTAFSGTLGGAQTPILVAGKDRKERLLGIVLLGDGASTSASLVDATTGAKLNQFGISNIERVEIVTVPYNNAGNIPGALDSWIDVSAGMPGTIYFSAAPSVALFNMRIKIMGTV